MKTILFLAIAVCSSNLLKAQDDSSRAYDGPVIDMHLHALPADHQGPPPLAMCAPWDEFPAWDPAQPYGQAFMKILKEPKCSDPIWSPETDEELMQQTIEIVERRNIYGVLSGKSDRVAKWMRAAPNRFYPGLLFQLGISGISVDSLRSLYEDDRLAVFGEITNQYIGVGPDDERMDPYWALAEELDIPVGIHIGPGPPGVIYLGAKDYRARLHSALTLEEVLISHPKLRVYIMHAGFPMLDDLLTLLYAHPQVYVGLGVIAFSQPRAAFYRYLEGITDAGFGNRVMFGSDQMVWPEAIERSIEAIERAPFLSPEQKADIFYNNAARFLRLSEKEKDDHLKTGGAKKGIEEK